jgi:DNA-binding HxlR family transcriptional regulator
MDDMTDNDGSEADKIFESLFEPDNVEVLTELETGRKTFPELLKNTDLAEEKINQCLSYLIENGFVKKTKAVDNEVYYSVEAEKLSKVLESSENFKNVDDGLAKLDSFLN